MRRFLVDRAALIERDLMGRFKTGQLKLSEEPEYRGRLLEIEDINELTWTVIAEFYGLPRDEEGTESGTTIPDTNA